jgi:type I restriction enzyme S subunit
MRSRVFIDQWWARKGETDMADYVSLTAQRQLRVVVPPVSVQRRIAAPIESIDDLIENNRRRIEVLDEIARTIYGEWFVHFRYPGNENATLVESAMGPIPEGWEVGRVDSHFVLQRGFDLPASQRHPGPVPIVGASGRQGFHSTARARGPGLTTGRSGTVGVVTYVPGDFWPLNTSLWVKEFRLSTPRSAYFLLSSLDLRQASSGAAVPTLNRNVVHALPAVCPPRALIEQWDSAANPIFNSVEALRVQSERLGDLRDLLLPKLVTGQIDLSSLDVDALVEDSVA